MRSVSLALIVAGLAVMVTALAMDTTNHGVHNIGLLADRQISLFFGGIMFIGGIIFWVNIGRTKTEETPSSDNEEYTAAEQKLLTISRSFASRSLGQKLSLMAVTLATTSMFLDWCAVYTNIGDTGTETIYRPIYEYVGQGVGFTGLFVAAIWAYPAYNILMNSRVPLIGGIASGALSLMVGIFYLVHTLVHPSNTERFIEMAGSEHIIVQWGNLVFILASILLFVGCLYDKLSENS